MATDPRPGTQSFLLVVLALLTGYLAWQITPLRQRFDALERRQLATEDRLFGEMERLANQIDTPRGRRETAAPAAAPAKSAVAEKPSADTASAPPPAREAAAAPATAEAAKLDLVRFFSKRLLPEEATIASLMAAGIPVPEIARTTRHSIPYLLGKAAQIEKTLAAAPDTPPEALRAIRRSLAQAKGGQ